MGLMVQIPLFPMETKDYSLKVPAYWPYSISRVHQGKCLARGKYGSLYEKDCLIDLATKLELPNPNIKQESQDLPWDA